MSDTNTEEVKEPELADSAPKDQGAGDNAEEDLKASNENHENPMPSPQQEVQLCSANCSKLFEISCLLPCHLLMQTVFLIEMIFLHQNFFIYHQLASLGQ